MARLPNQPNLFVVATRTNNIWLINRDDKDCTLSATELFGFNTGSYTEVPSGQVYSPQKLKCCRFGKGQV